MKNPWMKKNPFLSMWLSAANTMAGQARGHATAAMARESGRAATNAANQGARMMMDFWAAMLKPPTPPRRRRRRG